MTETPPSPPDTGPMTVEHGRRIFNKTKEIIQLLGQLMPLLKLMEPPVVEEGADPIDAILRLLESLSVQGSQAITCLDEIDAKLDLLLSNSGMNVP